MGELIMMPKRETATEQASAVETKQADRTSGIDFSVWKAAPKERTAAYFPTYSAISKAMQTAMRGWVREWFNANPEVLLRPHTAYPILVYQCTTPFSGKPTNIFTYDIQQTEALNRAFASAASKLGRDLKQLDPKNLAWLTREHYFAYRSKEVVKYVAKNRRALYKMLNVETVLVDSILKFVVIDIPKMGLEEAVVVLRRAFNTQLNRFSEDVDLSNRAEQLLRIATDTLLSKLPNASVVAMPLAA
ncbi:MAG: hypothetical protein M3Y57_10885 [Acidobacteriota bacterium]|nr:hypothetical protein [Acidobacteriota bacterium]